MLGVCERCWAHVPSVSGSRLFEVSFDLCAKCLAEWFADVRPREFEAQITSATYAAREYATKWVAAKKHGQDEEAKKP